MARYCKSNSWSRHCDCYVQVIASTLLRSRLDKLKRPSTTRWLPVLSIVFCCVGHHTQQKQKVGFSVSAGRQHEDSHIRCWLTTPTAEQFTVTDQLPCLLTAYPRRPSTQHNQSSPYSWNIHHHFSSVRFLNLMCARSHSRRSSQARLITQV